MERKDFIHSSTRIRSLESKLLTKEQFDRMIESNSLEDAIKVLQETSYSDVFNKIDRPEDYDKAIYNELTNLYETVMDLSNNRDVVDIVSLKYDAHNMKVILKDHVMGTDNTNLIYPMGRIKVSNVAEQAEKGDRKGIDKMLDGLATEAVYDYGDTLNPQSVDLAVDKRFYNNLLKISEKTDLDTLRKYAKDFIDFSNLIALFRMQRQNRNPEYAEKVISVSGNIDRKEILRLFNEPISVIVDKFKRTNIGKRLYKGFIQYEETGSIASFEKEFDNHIMDIAKEVKFISYGPEVIFAYLIAREIEIKNIRVILVSKLNKLSPEFIRKGCVKLMYKVGVVGDRDSVLAFKALGLEVATCTNPEESRRAVDKMARNEFGIIFITEQLANQIPETINRYNSTMVPAIILIPSNQGTLNIGMDRINENVEKAIGSNIL